MPNCGKIERLEIEVTRRCPLKCMHCSSRAGQGKLSSELSLEEIIRIISEFSELGGKIVTITGGEPFVRGESFILDILEVAEKCSLLTHIYTSGYLMNERMTERIQDNGVDMICVSVEGLEETHDVITGVNGSYRRAVKTLELLQKYKVPSRIHFTPMRMNFSEFQHVVNLGEAFGVRDVKVFNFSPQGRGYDNRHRLGLSPTETDEFAVLAMKAMSQCGVDIRFGGLVGGLNHSCSVGRKIAITCEGDILPCLGLRERIETLGNVIGKPFLEAWRTIERITPHNTCLCATLKAPT